MHAFPKQDWCLLGCSDSKRVGSAGTQPHRLRWFRAFFESEAELTGVKGAPGFTTWVDGQTIEWRAAESMDSPSDSEPETLSLIHISEPTRPY